MQSWTRVHILADDDVIINTVNIFYICIFNIAVITNTINFVKILDLSYWEIVWKEDFVIENDTLL